jgi:hypothetical protein
MVFLAPGGSGKAIAIPMNFAAQPSEPIFGEAVTNIATFLKLGRRIGLLSPQCFRASPGIPMRQSGQPARKSASFVASFADRLRGETGGAKICQMRSGFRDSPAIYLQQRGRHATRCGRPATSWPHHPPQPLAIGTGIFNPHRRQSPDRGLLQQAVSAMRRRTCFDRVPPISSRRRTADTALICYRQK